MEDSIANLHVKFSQPQPSKTQHSPYKHTPIVYGAKMQYAAGPKNIPHLNAAGILRVQAIIFALLFSVRAVDNKLLLSLSEVYQQQASATKATRDAIYQLLDYVATYPSDGITFRASNMVLSAHTDAENLNVSKARSQAGAHIMLSEDVPVTS